MHTTCDIWHAMGNSQSTWGPSGAGDVVCVVAVSQKKRTTKTANPFTPAHMRLHLQPQHLSPGLEIHQIYRHKQGHQGKKLFFKTSYSDNGGWNQWKRRPESRGRGLIRSAKLNPSPPTH